MNAFLAGCLTRLRRSRLQTLLLLLLCACDETIDPTVLRFYVYSDVELARVRVALLDVAAGDGGMEQEITPQKAADSGANLRFTIAVERTDRSNNREQAVLSFEGYANSDPSSQIVLRQTVRADFADKQTKLVRIWLSQACVRETSQYCRAPKSCDGTSGLCGEPSTLSSEQFDGGVDLSRWQPPEYRACGERDQRCPLYCSAALDPDCSPRGPALECSRDEQCAVGGCECVDAECAQMRCCTPPNCARTCAADLDADPKNCGLCKAVCAYPRCVAGQCATTSIVPPRSTETPMQSGEFANAQLVRFVSSGRALAGVGVFADEPNASVRMVLMDDDLKAPGVVRKSGLAARSADADARGVELVFAEPTVPPDVFWIGFEATGMGGIRSQLVGADAGVYSDYRRASTLPGEGQSLPASSVSESLSLARPHVYAITYDP